MHSVDEAMATVLEYAQTLSREQVSISAAYGRVLSEDIIARRVHPPWDNSAMDGYAVQWSDIQDATADSPVILKYAGEVQAGSISAHRLNSAEAIQIMTGAALPAGADTVIRNEDTRLQGDQVYILKTCSTGSNVRRQGEDITLGATVINSGTIARPADIGMLATAGYVWVQVSRQPTVAILTTGDELVNPGEQRLPGQIINSNAYAIGAQVQEAGAIPIILATAKDDKADLKAKILSASEADITLVVGGVSVGKYDYAKDIIQALGYDMKFWRVNMRPGLPLAFGVFSALSPAGKQNKLLFGLPGNPVSCMISFYQFIRPLLRKMMGATDCHLNQISAALTQAIQHKPGRRHYARAIVQYYDGQYHVQLTGDQSSGMMTSMTQANALLILPETGGKFNIGDMMPVQLLPTDRAL